MFLFPSRKVGFGLIALGVCGLCFCVSIWKHRAPVTETMASQSRVRLPHRKSTAALIARAEEDAAGRGNDLRSGRRRPNQGDGFDDSGDVFHRRATPALLSQTTTPARDNFDEPDVEAGAWAAPLLRIHGRRAPILKENFAGSLGQAVSHVAGQIKETPLLESPPLRIRPQRFVPFGRLIKAELVITLESTQDEMPLVGLITEPVYNNGQLVIPAGTELHSTARPDRIRDRIVSTAIWRLVFPREGVLPNGRQLVFDGIALDREDRDGNGLTWGLTDGSYGLKGREIHNGQTQETLLLFAAEAIKAAGSSLMDRQQTVLGEQVQANARNAALSGGQAVLSHVAEGIAKEIERNGVYIQVPAGKEFYVYPRQIIDPDRADIPDNVAKVE